MSDIWVVYMTNENHEISHSSLVGFTSFDQALIEASLQSGNAKAEFDIEASTKILGATLHDKDGGQIVQVAKLPMHEM